MNTATFVKSLDWRGDARLYRLSAPVDVDEYGGHGVKTTDFVVVSAVAMKSHGICETHIFPSDAEGKPYNFLELAGSFQGGLDHARALNNAGYEVTQ